MRKMYINSWPYQIQKRAKINDVIVIRTKRNKKGDVSVFKRHLNILLLCVYMYMYIIVNHHKGTEMFMTA